MLLQLKSVFVPITRSGVDQWIPIEAVTREELKSLCRRMGQCNVIAEDLLAEILGFRSLHIEREGGGYE